MAENLSSESLHTPTTKGLRIKKKKQQVEVADQEGTSTLDMSSLANRLADTSLETPTWPGLSLMELLERFWRRKDQAERQN